MVIFILGVVIFQASWNYACRDRTIRLKILRKFRLRLPPSSSHINYNHCFLSHHLGSTLRGEMAEEFARAYVFIMVHAFFCSKSNTVSLCSVPPLFLSATLQLLFSHNIRLRNSCAYTALSNNADFYMFF